MTRCEIINGHVISALRQLEPESVQMVVTSPPYWGLRSYGTEPQIWGGREDCPHAFVSLGSRHRGGPAGKGEANKGRDRSAQDSCGDVSCGDFCTSCGASRGEHGLEPSPALFVEHEVMIFREVWRVLRDDGTLWLNLGDTYASSGGHADKNCNDRRSSYRIGARPEREHRVRAGKDCDPKREARAEGQPYRHSSGSGLRPKNLVGIPWRVALALQADGWILRSDIIWHKPNPMPESVSDRPTKAHEYLFLLTKSESYYYDWFAARESVSGTANSRGSGVNPKAKHPSGWASGTGRAHNELNGRYRPKQNASFSEAVVGLVNDRNWRDVWSIITEAFAEAHYATFPRELPKRAIIAGTSEGGCCAKCGAPRERIVEAGEPDREHQRACGGDLNGEYHGKAKKDFASARAQDASAVKARILEGMREKKTVGWKASCDCAADTTACTVLDPFGGSGTTGQVAQELGRHAVLIELLPANIKLIERRTAQAGLILHP